MLLLAAAARSAEDLATKIEREVVTPVLSDIQRAASQGKEPSFQFNPGPMSPAAARLTAFVRERILGPLMSGAENAAAGAARALGSSDADASFSLPEAPSFDFSMPDWALAGAGLVTGQTRPAPSLPGTGWARPGDFEDRERADSTSLVGKGGRGLGSGYGSGPRKTPRLLRAPKPRAKKSRSRLK